MILEKIKKAENETELNPSELQKKEGNYKKGKVTIEGLQITIENPKGSMRCGIDSDNNKWEIKMPFTYGYFNSTIGKDGDQIDVLLGNHFENFDVYIVDQKDVLSNAFDEHKVMYGFKSESEAKQAYFDCYEQSWGGFLNITRITLPKFKKWLVDKSMIKYPAYKLNNIAKMDIKNKIVDKISLIRMFGEVESEKTLNSLKAQAGNEEEFDELIIEIASPGGSVSEGLEIMMWLDHLSNLGKKITTVVVANAYSIASLIMLAAHIRLISKHGEVMVHNPMIPELEYVNANDLEKHISELRSLEDSMYELYKIFTGLETDKIKELMDNETYLSPKEAVGLGFADMVVDINKKSFRMTTNKQKKVNMNKMINSLKRTIAMVQKSDHVNQVYTDKNSGDEIEVYQTDPSTYQKGDKTNKESGEYVLSDGAKVIIEDFNIVEIDRSATVEDFNEGVVPIVETPVENNDGENKPAVIESQGTDPAKVIEKTESTITTKEIQNAEIAEVIKWELSVVQDSFEVGTKVEFKPSEDGGEPFGVGAGEFQLENGDKILTDSQSVVRLVMPPETPAETPVEIPVENKEIENKEIEAKKSDEEMKKQIEALDLKNKELEDKIAKIENSIKVDAKEIENKFENIDKFQDIAAEAIDKVASSTSSSFSPQAKAKSKPQVGGNSIFQKLRKERGL